MSIIVIVIVIVPMMCHGNVNTNVDVPCGRLFAVVWVWRCDVDGGWMRWRERYVLLCSMDFSGFWTAHSRTVFSGGVQVHVHVHDRCS